MKKTRKPLYLNKTIFLVTLIGYSAFLVLMLLMDWYMIRNYQYEKKNEKKAALESCVADVEDSMEKIDQLLYDIYANNEDFQALRKQEESVQEYGHAYELRETLKGRMIVEEDLSGFYIFYDNGQKSWYGVNENHASYAYSFAVKEILLERLKAGGQMRNWSTVEVGGKVSLAMYYKKERVAVFGTYIFRNMEKAITEKAGAEAELSLVQGGTALTNGELAEKLGLAVYIEDAADSFEAAKNGYQIFGRRITNTDLWVCTAYRVNLWSSVTLQQILLLLITALSVAAVFLLLVFLRKQVVAPLHQLTDSMNDIRSGKTREVPELGSRFREFTEVRTTLEKMVRELEEQKNLTYEEIIEKQKAQMQYLQLQLKPHFYLNGLKTINALAMEHQDEKIQELVWNLSVHLRYLLQAEQETVPLSKELEFVENYVLLQKHVTGRPVSCEIFADEEVSGWEVPVLAVQTFVENSVKYARFGNPSAPLEIQVTARYLKTGEEEGDYLDLTVQDNGQGYTEEILTEINGDPAAGKRCVGINNIKRRCQFLYGERAEFRFENNGGALSELILPDREKTESETLRPARMAGECPERRDNERTAG